MNVEMLKTVSSSDAADLNHLMSQLSGKPVTEASLRRCVESGNTELLVIREGQKIVATATLNFMTTLTGVRAHLDHVIVDEAYRGKGLGKLLTQEAIACAKERGASKVELTSRPSRIAANGLYQKIGFAKKETNFYQIEF